MEEPEVNDLELLTRACRRGLPPVPTKSFRLGLELARDDESSNELLVEHLESDARLRFGILVGANLSLFAARSSPKTIPQAVAQLGRRKCAALLWVLTLSDFIQHESDMNPKGRRRLWRHSLLTGVLTHYLLKAADQESLGDGLTAGMAHDIGHALLAQPAPRLEVVWHEEHESLMERDHAPDRDHCRLGAALLSFWDAPSFLIAAAAHHHEPRAADREAAPLVVAVRMADILAEYVDLDRPARALHLESSPAWQPLTQLAPWNQIPRLDSLALSCLPESLLAAEHLMNLLGA